ncbi:MAG: Trk system potassium transporter TrkA [Pseudodesulfovibrio sp.]|uniref:Trk system potassium uptake protein TrkA n=1 Tax=Pseudodesulfovibrio aespoeensis (strain ATCC 700646 / DSM 10631 / Aspo-2) TaxID=643562 RepID=E6VYH0_PSEA9|nr:MULTISPECIES: Trk system potassium transporter TrkA [Pseudodesulfovibrio]MBU4192178.1 Trk system potassium transporter TrkA [Pseudomonadota bacterium]MCG2731742.1 Trk system potassium transporter TrkA [Pseudodesulfovibrio aespoeensis]ADU62733.1 TrkA-N domain protein [Pseudodesulfovibrio aespoeensis Aspo-2]MBU4244702.1 Trk system potassium transporter TrkA [Pseudomonadota bacterium]MBU4379909.1 Trk system potassium transporter TrkA [Pseudomonadota bacterium]
MRIIIIGAGEVGYHLAQRLAVEDKEVLVIDKSADALRKLAESSDVQTIQGSGSSPEILEQAGIAEADILLAVTDSDEINLICCFFANMLSSKVTKLARIRSSMYTNYKHLLTGEGAGITKIINPDEEVVNSILRLMSVPGAVEINEFADGKIRLIGINLPDESPAVGIRLMQLREIMGDDLRVVIAALVRDGELIIPRGGDRIKQGDVVYFACDILDQEEVLLRLGIQVDPVRTVMILGGGNIGYKLAKALDNKFFHTRVLENRQKRCEFLSERLDRPIVLMGDSTDQEILREENIQDMDMVIAVTGDEETNILSCLLAKSLGAKRTVTRVNNFGYMPLIEPIGIDYVVCPRLSAINSLLHYIRRGKIISTVSIKGEQAEALEAIALEDSPIVGKAIMDLDLPRGCLVLCFQRKDAVVIPRGDTVIEPQDRLLIISTRANIPKVEKALTTKVEFF